MRVSEKGTSTESDGPIARIRVRQFAHEDAIAKENLENNTIKATIATKIADIDIISLSSEEECKPKPKKIRKTRQRYVRPSRVSGKPLLLNKYHKISEYFPSIKKDNQNSVATIDHAKTQTMSALDSHVTVPDIKTNEEVHDIQNVCSSSASTILPTKYKRDILQRKAKNTAKDRIRHVQQSDEQTASTSSKDSEKHSIAVIKRRENGACITKELKVVLKKLNVIKRFDEQKQNDQIAAPKQAKLSSYMNDSNGVQNRAGDYFVTHEASIAPFMVRIESQNSNNPVPTHQFQSFQLKTEVTYSQIHVEETSTAKSISAPSISPQPQNSKSEIQIRQVQSVVNNLETLSSESLVGSESARSNQSNQRKLKISKNAKSKRSKPVCPTYKIIPGTQFSVDAFRYGDIDGIEHYFLSHFHADHYIGLKKSFCRKLYASDITARLVIEFIKVPEQYITTMEIGAELIVDDVTVIALEANHCPGAVMFLFKFPTGKCVLHTGDFRADPTMEEYPEFWNNKIDSVYLDTTYLSKNYDFCTQSESMEKVIADVESHRKLHAGSNGRTLIVCGAYKIGKEKVWMSIAQTFNYKVWVDKERKRALECIGNRDILSVIVDSPIEADVHILTMGEINYKRLVTYLDMFGEHFERLIAFNPSGWNKKTKVNKSRVCVVGVEYSEHSSYNELKRFVHYIQPTEVISTVPFTSSKPEITPQVPKSWLTRETKPMKIGNQSNIKNYFKEMQGSKPKKPSEEPISECIESIEILDSDSDYMP